MENPIQIANLNRHSLAEAFYFMFTHFTFDAETEREIVDRFKGNRYAFFIERLGHIYLNRCNVEPINGSCDALNASVKETYRNLEHELGSVYGNVFEALDQIFKAYGINGKIEDWMESGE